MFPFVTAQGAKTSASPAGGAQALLERAPGLKDGVERVVASVVKSLQTMAGTVTTIEGMLAGVASSSAKEVVAAHTPDAAASLIECPELGCVMLATLDATLVHAIVELLCGGNGSEPRPMSRAATPIDHQFSHIVFTLTASAIQSEWAEFGFGGARAAKIEGALAADRLGPRIKDVAVVRMTIGAFGLHGSLRLVLPPAALERFHGAETSETSPSSANDPAWSALLHKEVGRAAVTLDAYLDANEVTLAALTELKVGQILALPADARSRVSLVCDGRELYRGEIGQADDRYSLRIDEIVSEPTTTPATDARPRRLPRSEPSEV